MPRYILFIFLFYFILFLALQADLSALQFHVDQAFLAQQLANTSSARAVAQRSALIRKLRLLYETDHAHAAASAFAVDDATALALHGLLQGAQSTAALFPADPDGSLLDQLLLCADPDIFTRSHPTLSATRAALAAPASSSGAAPPSRVVSQRTLTPSDDGMEVDDYEDVDATPPDTREPDASLASDDDDYDDGYEN